MTPMLADEYSGKNDDKKPLIATRDNVSEMLLQLYADAQAEAGAATTHENNALEVEKVFKDLLMQKLCSYIVRRDHTVHNHAYHLGKESHAKTNSKNTD